MTVETAHSGRSGTRRGPSAGAEPGFEPVFDVVLERSDHVTIRVVCFRSGPLGGDLARTLEPFTALGVYGEGVAHYGMVALDIEPTAPLAAIAVALRRGVEAGSWEYEEGSITPAWIAATER